MSLRNPGKPAQSDPLLRDSQDQSPAESIPLLRKTVRVTGLIDDGVASQEELPILKDRSGNNFPTFCG